MTASDAQRSRRDGIYLPVSRPYFLRRFAYYIKTCGFRARGYFLEFHDFSTSRARSCPDAADEAPLLALQAFNLRFPIERPTSSFPIVSRNQASGRGRSCSLSSLKFSLPRREQAAAFSHSPRQGVWLQTERLLRLQTFVPHSQDSRLPSA